MPEKDKKKPCFIVAIGDPEWRTIYSEIMRPSRNVAVVFCKSYGDLLKILADRSESPQIWIFLDYFIRGMKPTDSKSVNDAIKAVRKDAMVTNPVPMKL